ncbi:MAG: MurR/RpiR family transcriptional regulator [Ruminococcaceae bacterium]|nr:MurR/RpiR family transcriptional regulator [Oscillospiraceae bacterium]
MESVIHKIRFLKSEMGPGEKKLASYILENPSNITNMTINELADHCDCGNATVVRFSRRLGFDGFQALKIGIATELGSASSISAEINKTDNCYEIFLKRANDVQITLQNTADVLDATALSFAANKIMKAKRIVLFGLGNSAAIATDAAHKFLRLGLNAQACCDNHMQAIIASHLNSDCVAIGISHSGASVDTVEALRIAKSCNATTICVTNHSDSPIVKASDIVLFTKAEETRHSILALSSRIAQLAIFDAIYTYIVVNTDKTAMQAIYDTEIALQNKKYSN